MSTAAFDSRDPASAVETAARRPFPPRKSPGTRWRRLPLALRDVLIIAAVLSFLFGFSSLLHHLLG
jgi:hypothetical protein